MKKILSIATVLAAVAMARADVIYWMVSDDVANGNVSGVESAATSSQNPYAKLMVTLADGTGSPTMIDSKAASAVSDAADWGEYFTTTIGSAYANNSYSFYVELYNGYRTEASNYDTLVSNGYIAKSGSIQSPVSFAGGSFGQTSGSTYNVPEPTSGLLFLVGGMLLGLKRRRMA
jgi:hypothetical protein